MCCVLSRSLSCDPMDYSPPGSSVHGDSPGKNTGMDSHFLLQGIVLTQGSNSSLPHCRWILYHRATVTDISFCFYFFNELSTILVFPAGSDGKESAWNVGDLGSILGQDRSPGGGHGNPLHLSGFSPGVFLPGESHGQRSLVSYSPWGRKELDTTELLTLHYYLYYPM